MVGAGVMKFLHLEYVRTAVLYPNGMVHVIVSMLYGDVRMGAVRSRMPDKIVIYSSVLLSSAS